MLTSPAVSPALGVFITAPNHVTYRNGLTQYRRNRHGAKSAPPQVWHKRNQFQNASNSKNQVQYNAYAPNTKKSRNCSTAGARRVVRMRQSANSTNENGDVKLRVDDVVWLAEQTREMTSLENRRSVMEEAQKTIRQETSIPDSSRPHSVIGVGLQAMTSPMPFSSKQRHRPGQVNHIPVLLSLPSDRTFIPSSDQQHARHLTTPADEDNTVQEQEQERSHSVAKQCCEIMGPSLCRTCRKLESRLLNREQAEKECPRMRITQENITTTQMVKRFYPGLTDTEIQDKIARGEIARTGFPPPKFCRRHRRCSIPSSSDDDSDDSSPEENSVKKENRKQNPKFNCQHVGTLMLELAKLKSKLKNKTSTPLYFTDLKRIQSKLVSGEVDRRKYLTKEPKESTRLKSAISSISTASSTKTTLSKLGVRLSESLMPVFVSPRKVKICEEPSYKAYYEPPLLSKRRQIPNPSFFAGSSDAYSLPERLPDIIEFADSKIKLLEKQGRSVSSMSMFSNVSEDYENLASERALESARSGDNNIFNLSNSQKELKKQLSIQEQSEHETNSTQEEPLDKVAESEPEHCNVFEENGTNTEGNVVISVDSPEHGHDKLLSVRDSKCDGEEEPRQIISEHRNNQEDESLVEGDKVNGFVNNSYLSAKEGCSLENGIGDGVQDGDGGDEVPEDKDSIANITDTPFSDYPGKESDLALGMNEKRLVCQGDDASVVDDDNQLVKMGEGIGVKSISPNLINGIDEDTNGGQKEDDYDIGDNEGTGKACRVLQALADAANDDDNIINDGADENDPEQIRDRIQENVVCKSMESTTGVEGGVEQSTATANSQGNYRVHLEGHFEGVTEEEEDFQERDDHEHSHYGDDNDDEGQDREEEEDEEEDEDEVTSQRTSFYSDD